MLCAECTIKTQTELQPPTYLNQHNCTRIKGHFCYVYLCWLVDTSRSSHTVRWSALITDWHCQNFITGYLWIVTTAIIEPVSHMTKHLISLLACSNWFASFMLCFWFSVCSHFMSRRVWLNIYTYSFHWVYARSLV